jgi:exopolysaccharide biosynthesis polyprenyl glycosylphosphotransferase
MKIKTQNFIFFLTFMIIWYLIFSRLMRYDYSRRFSSRRSEIKDIIQATTLGTFILWLLEIVFSLNVVDKIFLLIFWVSSSSITILSRIILRYMLSQIRLRGRDMRHILFVGTNERAINFAQTIKSKKELGYHIIGFADNEWNEMQEFKKSGYPLVTDISRLPSYVERNVVDEIMICLPMKSFYTEVLQIVTLCEEQGIIVRFIPSVFDFKLSRSKIEQFEGEYVITLFRETLYWQVLIKHILDYSVSLVLLILLSPLFFLIAVLIKLTSPGPVFFIQERVGMNKRRFNLYKFRTMIPNALDKQAEIAHLNEVSGPVFKITNDPRIIPFGKILRRTSVDELPQLLNILKGDMSLVGPRPPIPSEVEQYEWRYRKRLSVKPGITCLWQTSGRSKIPFEKWMELDKEYIDNWSLWLDLKILLKTIPAVIRGSGAA